MRGTICVLGQDISLPAVNNVKPVSVVSLLGGTNLCEEIILPISMSSKPKHKFSRAKWYEAKLPKDGQGAFNWCVQHFGKEPNHPDAWSRWYFNVNRTFRFRDAKDYEWFMLRWS